MFFQLLSSMLALSLLAPTWGQQVCSKEMMEQFDIDRDGKMDRVEYANMLIELVGDKSCDMQDAWRAEDSNWAASFQLLSCLCSDTYGQVAGQGDCCLNNEYPKIATFPVPGVADFTEDQDSYAATVCGVIDIAIASECPRSQNRFGDDASLTSSEAETLPIDDGAESQVESKTTDAPADGESIATANTEAPETGASNADANTEAPADGASNAGASGNSDASSNSDASTAQAQEPQKQSNSTLWILLGLVIGVVVAAFIGYYATRKSQEDNAQESNEEIMVDVEPSKPHAIRDADQNPDTSDSGDSVGLEQVFSKESEAV